MIKPGNLSNSLKVKNKECGLDMGNYMFNSVGRLTHIVFLPKPLQCKEKQRVLKTTFYSEGLLTQERMSFTTLCNL